MRRPSIAVSLLCFLWACGGPGGTDGTMNPTGSGSVSDFVRGQGGGVAVVLDKDTLYWADVGGFIRAAGTLAAERYDVVNARGAFINRLAVDADRIYWTSRAPEGVFWAPKGGNGDPTTLVALPSGSPAFGIAVDDQFVYFTTGIAGKLMRVKKDGTELQTIAHDMGSFGELAVDATDAYYENGYVYRVPLAGGADPVRLGVTGTKAAPAQLALAGDFVYEWVAADPGGDATLFRTPKKGGTSDQLGSAPGEALDVAIEGGTAYCIAKYDVLDIALAGGSTTVLAKDEFFPRQVVADDQHVFWITNGGVRWATR